MSVLQQLPAEATANQFLHWCLQGRWDAKALQMAQSLVDQLDWQIFSQLVEQEDLGPLLYACVRGQALVPAPIEQSWSEAYYRNACRNTLLFRELAEVLQQLASHNIPVILLKGASLAELVYQDIALRPMHDLDVLIRSQDLAVTKQVLTELGYTSWGVEMQTGYIEEFRNEEVFYKDRLTDIFIDLHWKLVSPIYYQHFLSEDWFWQTALPVQLNQIPTLMLGYEAQVLYLCTHLVLHHEGQGLFWQYDIAEIITRYAAQINWEKILSQAQACDLVLPLQKILPHIAAQWHVPIPARVLEELQTLQPSLNEVQVFTWANVKYLKTTLRCFLTDLSGISDWRQRLKFALNTLFPTRAYMQYRYQIPHPGLVPFYYPYRLLQGLVRTPHSS